MKILEERNYGDFRGKRHLGKEEECEMIDGSKKKFVSLYEWDGELIK